MRFRFFGRLFAFIRTSLRISEHAYFLMHACVHASLHTNVCKYLATFVFNFWRFAVFVNADPYILSLIFFGRTDLIIAASKAKNCGEVDGEVRLPVDTPKLAQNYLQTIPNQSQVEPKRSPNYLPTFSKMCQNRFLQHICLLAQNIPLFLPRSSDMVKPLLELCRVDPGDAFTYLSWSHIMSRSNFRIREKKFSNSHFYAYFIKGNFKALSESMFSAEMTKFFRRILKIFLISKLMYQN